MDDLARSFLVFYGFFGGWLGMAFAIYLHRMRPDEQNVLTIFGMFAVGFSMWVTMLTLAGSAVPEDAQYVLLFVSNTLLITFEVALFGGDAKLQFAQDIHQWAFENPRFVMPDQLPDDYHQHDTEPEPTTDA